MLDSCKARIWGIGPVSSLFTAPQSMNICRWYHWVEGVPDRGEYIKGGSQNRQFG